MVRVIFELRDGRCIECRGYIGESVMDVALDNGIPGIAARCGGAGHCTTCHAYVDAGWAAALDPPRADEREMLRGLRGRRPPSQLTRRLTCQIALHDGLDGIVVHTD